MVCRWRNDSFLSIRDEFFKRYKSSAETHTRHLKLSWYAVTKLRPKQRQCTVKSDRKKVDVPIKYHTL